MLALAFILAALAGSHGPDSPRAQKEATYLKAPSETFNVYAEKKLLADIQAFVNEKDFLSARLGISKIMKAPYHISECKAPTVHEQVRKYVVSLPLSIRQALETPRDKKKLEDALARNDFSEVEDIANELFFSETGLEARAKYAFHLLDRGYDLFAAAQYEALLKTYESLGKPVPEAIQFKAMEAISKKGDPEAARGNDLLVQNHLERALRANSSYVHHAFKNAKPSKNEVVEFIALKDYDCFLQKPALRIRGEGAISALAAIALDFAVREEEIKRLLPLLSMSDAEAVTQLVRLASERTSFFLQVREKLETLEARPHIEKVFRVADKELRSTAAKILSNVTNSGEFLALTLKNEDPAIRREAALALRTLAERKIGSTPILIEALKNEDAVVRTQIGVALLSLEDPTATEALIVALGDSSGDVRWWSAAALKKIRSEKALPRLLKLQKEEKDDSVANMAGQAIDAINAKKSSRRD